MNFRNITDYLVNISKEFLDFIAYRFTGEYPGLVSNFSGDLNATSSQRYWDDMKELSGQKKNIKIIQSSMDLYRGEIAISNDNIYVNEEWIRDLIKGSGKSFGLEYIV